MMRLILEISGAIEGGLLRNLTLVCVQIPVGLGFLLERVVRHSHDEKQRWLSRKASRVGGGDRDESYDNKQIGRAHVCTPVT